MAKLEEVNGVIGKDCSICKEWKPLEEYYKQKEGLGGRKSGCKKCKGDQIKKWREENPHYHKEYSKNWNKENRKNNATIRKRRKLEVRMFNGEEITGKECAVCDSWKPLYHFNNHKKGLGGKDTRCKTCHAKYLREYRLTH